MRQTIPIPATYFDYALQVYIVAGRVAVCGHSERMRRHVMDGEPKSCCNAWALQGLTPSEASERMLGIGR